MSTWSVEVVTNETSCTTIELEAEILNKVNYNHIVVNGNEDWVLPSIEGMSFGEVLEVEG